MTDITSPHDLFFRKTWENKDIVRSFIENHVPAEIRDCLDLDTLKIEKDTFVDPKLKAHYSDILYSLMTKDGRPIRLYLLFEHKSYQDGDTFYQLLRYQMRILALSRKQSPNKKTLTPILPLILYHGKDGWRLKPQFVDLFDAPSALKPYLLNFQPVVCDLSQLNDEEIKGKILMQVTLRLFKHIFNHDLAEQLPNILALLQTLSEKNTVLEYLEAVLRYLSSASDYLKERDLEVAVRAALPNIGDEAMTTIAEMWMAKGEATTLRRLMKKKFGEVPKNAEDRIEKANSDTLLEWSENVLSAETIDEVFH